MNYSFNINTWVNWLLPAPIRQAGMIQWLNSLLAPIGTLHGLFLQWSDATRFDLTITGQVRSLEYHLNRVFANGDDIIYIEDGVGSDLVFIYTEAENQPVYLPGFLTKSGVDFLVFIPYSIDFMIPEITQFVNRHKLPTKTWEFRFFGTPS